MVTAVEVYEDKYLTIDLSNLVETLKSPIIEIGA
jgi:hypothetical protein